MQVAVRSEEPYKLQGYSILKSLSAPDYISDPDATGKLFSADFIELARHSHIHDRV